MARNKWQVHRAGILNYWYYSEAEFLFADGRLLLRGGNGSGKSVTMQSLVTVLLDGVKTPDRLDSFGSRSRRMEEYLLGEKEVGGCDERTGYLYLEYKREETDQYLTTGIGLHARRGAPLDSWGFVLADGRRPGVDFDLCKEERDPETGEKRRVPLSRRALEKAVGAGGRVVRSQKEYMELVNRHVFGFESTDKYQELMKLLVQLRRPKLSRDFRPSVIYEILNASLPALSDEELRPLSETIESMERTKQSIAQLESERAAFGRICGVYDAYNRGCLAERSAAARACRDTIGRVAAQGGVQAARARSAADARDAAAALLQALESERRVLEGESEAWKQHDVFRAKREEEALAHELAEMKCALQRGETALQEKKRREFSLRSQSERCELALAEKRRGLQETLAELDELAQAEGFAGHGALADAFVAEAAETALHFRAWKEAQAAHAHLLAELAQCLAQRDRLAARNQVLELELGDLAQRLDALRAETEQARRCFGETREALVKAYYEWRVVYGDELPLEQAEERRLAVGLQTLLEETVWSAVLETLDGAYRRQVEALTRRAGLQAAETEGLQAQADALRAELQALRLAREPEPLRLDDHAAARRCLEAQGIAFAPLYAAAEFRESVSLSLRERIEAALTEMGLLDALILGDEPTAGLPSEMYGAVLLPDPQFMVPTLADYLRPAACGGVSEARIADALSSIIIDERFYGDDADATSLSLGVASGVYRIGGVHGRAARRGEALYIGAEARRRYRKRQIAETQARLAEAEAAVCAAEVRLKALQGQLDAAAQARRDFPAGEACAQVHRALQEALQRVGLQEERVRDKDAQKKEVALELRALQEKLRADSAVLGLPLRAEAYAEAMEAAQDYGRALQEAELAQRDLKNLLQNLSQDKETLSYVVTEVDELRGAVLAQQSRCDEQALRLEKLRGRLKALGAEAVQRKIDAVLARLRQIPEEIKAQLVAQNRAEFEQREAQTRHAALMAKRDFYAQLSTKWEAVLSEELRLALTDTAREDAALRALETAWRQEKAELTDLLGKVSNCFFREQGALLEYGMQLRTLEVSIGEMPPLPAEDAEGLEQAWRALTALRSRTVLLLVSGGRTLSPYQQRQLLEERVARQKALLSEQDKRLYEEIIMNSIGRIISQRIHAAEGWIGKMNGLMSQRDTSSGLKFKLEWKTRVAERDDELDAQELVGLLHADPVLLKPQDMDKMVRHFQARIARAKEESSERSAEPDSFQSAVRDLLDYRKWFQFRLFYDQGEKIRRRELTDKVFFKFSGGEKAMAMYIPLFSAAYSRYQEAGEDAPYLITLDEAFAGVDERNIRDMFALVEQLQFNYIMNSQALWGDYDTVPSLNIYELLRPVNAAYVTLVHYHWDGAVRVAVSEDTAAEDV